MFNGSGKTHVPMIKTKKSITKSLLIKNKVVIKIIINNGDIGSIKNKPTVNTDNILIDSLKDVKSPDTEKKLHKTRRSKKGGKRKIYFGSETEDAIVKYNNLPDWAEEERNQIFEEKIKYPFEKLVENVFNTFKFSYFETSPLDVQKEAISHLVANIHKFEKNKGKAFSYFSIVAKNFLIYLNNFNYKKFNQNVDISEEREENTVQLQSRNDYIKNVETKEFIKLMVDFWEKNVNKVFNKQRDLDIANAVIELFRNSERIDSFNKKALYLYIREISSCRTQQITKVINKMKYYQRQITKNYIKSGTID